MQKTIISSGIIDFIEKKKLKKIGQTKLFLSFTSTTATLHSG